MIPVSQMVIEHPRLLAAWRWLWRVPLALVLFLLFLVLLVGWGMLTVERIFGRIVSDENRGIEQ